MREAMNEDQVVHALLTPVRRFPAKAVARATEDRALGVSAARRVLRAMLEEVAAGARPRPVEGTPFFDAAVSFGAIHACWILAYHGATEAIDELEAIVRCSDEELDALFGDVAHETLPAALDGVADEATLWRWASEPLGPEAEAAVHDALIRRLARGEVAREAAVATFDRALRRWRQAEEPRAEVGLALAALAYLSVCLADEAEPLRALLDAEGVGPSGAFTARDLDDLPADTAALAGRLATVDTSRRDPRTVEAMEVYGWLPPPKPAASKRRKKPKRKKRR